jgi:hypothetical protein
MLPDLSTLVRLTDEQLSRLDIAVVNLACAAGLLGSEKIDGERCIRTLDKLAGWVGRYTDHCLALRLPEETEFTEAQTRMRCLATVVWKGAGICYNPAKIPEDAPWHLADSFIHGAIYGEGGTCATLPIIYTAVGRRLGYPLKLATAWGPKWNHLFCRWDDTTGERFNVEVGFTGTSFPSDDYYRRFGLDQEREEAGLFLKSLTPREELAGFMAERAHRWRDCGQLRESADAYAWAVALSPNNRFFLNTLKMRLNDWSAKVKALTPPKFPRLSMSAPQRRYPPTLPLDLERYMYGLMASENMLRDQEFNAKWWERLRRGESLLAPAVALVDFAPDGSCIVRFQFPSQN